MRALRFSVLLGLLMVSYQNCSSGVGFQASDELLASSAPNVPLDTTLTGGSPALPEISPGTPPAAATPTPGGDVATACPSSRVQIGTSCVCPAGSNDIGSSCLTCKAGEVFNAMTLKCDAAPVVCRAGETYDGHDCVAISPACDSYVEVTSAKFAIPARNVNADGKGKVCYYAKLVSKVKSASSSTYLTRRQDIVARLHDGDSLRDGLGNAPPHVMGSREISFVLQGDREVVLAGDSHGGDDIYVDNFFLVEVMYAGLTKPNLWASGTADALPFNSRQAASPILVNRQPVEDWHAFGGGGTSRFNPINMYNQLTRDKEISFKGSALDCGGIGETSDVYLLFR